MLIIALAVLVTLAYLNAHIQKNLLHPAVVFTVAWAVQLFALLILGHMFVEPSAETLMIVVTGAIAFTGGSLLASLRTNDSSPMMRPRVVRDGSSSYLFLALVVGVCVIGQFRIFMTEGGGSDFGTNLVLVRIRFTVDNEDLYGIFEYGALVALSSLILLQVLILKGQAKAIHKVLFGYFLSAAIVMAILSTGRAPLVLLMLLLCIVHVLMTRAYWRAGILLFAAAPIGFLIFWIMGSAMGKADDAASGASAELVTYLFSSIPALSVYLSQNPIELIGGDGGVHTFRFLFAVMAKLGFADKPPSLGQEFVSVPHLTNLYTTYLQYIKDFQLSGVVLLPAVIGAGHGLLFKHGMRRSRRSEFALYVLAVSYLPLLQTIFQETHFLSVSAWIQFALIGLLMTKTSPRVPRAKGLAYAESSTALSG